MHGKQTIKTESMKRILLFFAVITQSLTALTQDPTFIYNDSIELPINASNVLIYFNKDTINKESIFSTFDIVSEVVLPEDRARNYYAYIVSTDKNDYTPFINNLKDKDYV